MKKNIGARDRLLRAVFGLLLLGFAWWTQSWLLLGGALFCFYEALASWCLLYQLLEKSSCPIDKADR